jgi:tetratricopeptide (TPR) repeat protein
MGNSMVEKDIERLSKMNLPKKWHDLAVKMIKKEPMTEEELSELEGFADSYEGADKYFTYHGFAVHHKVRCGYEKSINWWTRLLDSDEYKLVARTGIADCYSLQSDWLNARKYLDQALVIAKDKGQLAEKKVNTSIKLLNRAEQMSDIQKSIDDLIEKDELEEAIVKCDELLSLVPASKTAHFKKAQIYVKQRKPVEAKKEFNLAK